MDTFWVFSAILNFNSFSWFEAVFLLVSPWNQVKRRNSQKCEFFKFLWIFLWTVCPSTVLTCNPATWNLLKKSFKTFWHKIQSFREVLETFWTISPPSCEENPAKYKEFPLTNREGKISKVENLQNVKPRFFDEYDNHTNVTGFNP